MGHGHLMCFIGMFANDRRGKEEGTNEQTNKGMSGVWEGTREARSG